MFTENILKAALNHTHRVYGIAQETPYRMAYVEIYSALRQACSQEGTIEPEEFDHLKRTLLESLRFVLIDHLQQAIKDTAKDNEGWVAESMSSDTHLTDTALNMIVDKAAASIIEAGVLGFPGDVTDADMRKTFIIIAERFIAQSILRASSTVRLWGPVLDSLNLNFEDAAMTYLGNLALLDICKANGDSFVENWWGIPAYKFAQKYIEAVRYKDYPVGDDFYNQISHHLNEQYTRLLNGESAIDL